MTLRRAGLLALILLILASPVILILTSTAIFIFRLEDFPGGRVHVNGQAFDLNGGNGWTVRALRIDRDSDIRLLCPVDAPVPPTGAGYVTTHLQALVILTVRGCELDDDDIHVVF